MLFKTHLFIILLIIASVYFVTQYFTEPKQDTVITQNIETSPYSINITRASWGLNCEPNHVNMNDVSDYYQSNSAKKIKENNLLEAVKNICEGKSKCDIAIDTAVLGEDPAPSCLYKELSIEYRCFAIDRLRTTKRSGGTISINCDDFFKE